MLKSILIYVLCISVVIGKPNTESEEYDYGEENVCITSVDSSAPETECIFPFTFNNFTYNGCPTDPFDETKRWCSTKTDENGNHVTGDGTWGYCTPGCKPEIFPDELLIGSDANIDPQTETCDYTACNGFTFKLEIFDKVETYGQCQFPAGENGLEDDYFCFVNANSACNDKVPYGDEALGLFVTTLACKDPKTPLPRTYGSYRRSFYKGFIGSNRRHKNSRYGSNYGLGRYSSGGYKGSSFHQRSGHSTSNQSPEYSNNQDSSYNQKQICQTIYKEECSYEQKQECKQTYKSKTTYENKKECETVYKTIYEKKQECHTTYTEECNHDDHGSSYGDSDYDSSNYGNSNYGYFNYGGSNPIGIYPRQNRQNRQYNIEKQVNCKRIPHKTCKYVDVPKQVPDTKCHYVKVPKKSHVPERICNYVKVPKCHKVPQKKCQTNEYKPRRRYSSSHQSSYGHIYRGR